MLKNNTLLVQNPKLKATGHKNFLYTLIISMFCANNSFAQPLIEQIQDILAPDSHLIWRVVPSLSRPFFNNTTITTDDRGFRQNGFSCPHTSLTKQRQWWIFGASPSFGFGVSNEDTFVSILNRKICDQHINLEIKNFSQIGYSIVQISKLLQEQLQNAQQNNTISNVSDIFFSFVINEIDYFRFFDIDKSSDLNFLAKNNWIYTNLQVPLVKNTAMRWLLGKIRRHGLLRPGAEHFIQRTPRVPLDDFKKELENIFSLCQKYKIQMHLLVLPVNLPQLPEEVKKHNEVVLKLKISNIQTANTITNLLETGKIEHPVIRSRLINFFQENNQAGKAKEQLDKILKSYALFGSSASEDYFTYQNDFAQKNKIPILDLRQKLLNEPQTAFLTAFGDTIHPSKRGHRIIADELTILLNQEDVKFQKTK